MFLKKTKNNKNKKKDNKKKDNKKNKDYNKTKKYVKQKGGEERMSDLDPEIRRIQKEKKQKQILLQTLIKIITEKNKKNKEKQKNII